MGFNGIAACSCSFATIGITRRPTHRAVRAEGLLAHRADDRWRLHVPHDLNSHPHRLVYRRDNNVPAVDPEPRARQHHPPAARRHQRIEARREGERVVRGVVVHSPEIRGVEYLAARYTIATVVSLQGTGRTAKILDLNTKFLVFVIQNSSF